MHAVLVFDQAGVDGGRERRVVQGDGQVLPPGLAGFLPRRADVITGGLQAKVGGFVVVALVVGDQLDLGVKRQGAQGDVDPFFRTT